MNALKAAIFFTAITAITQAIAGQKEICEQKLASLIIPSIDINGAKIESIVDYLRIMSKSLDTAEQDASRRGIAFHYKSGTALPATPLTLKRDNISLLNTLQEVVKLANLSFEVTSEGVVIGSYTEPSAVVASNTRPLNSEMPRIIGPKVI